MSQPLCITCGQPTGDDPFGNRLPTGEPCPTCRSRALDALPSLLPRTAVVEAEEALEEGVEAAGPRPLSESEPWGPGGFDDPPIGA